MSKGRQRSQLLTLIDAEAVVKGAGSSKTMPPNETIVGAVPNAFVLVACFRSLAAYRDD